MSDNDDTIRLLRTDEVLKRTALSRTRLFELLRAGLFPVPSKLPGSNINVWSVTSVDSWCRDILRKD